MADKAARGYSALYARLAHGKKGPVAGVGPRGPGYEAPSAAAAAPSDPDAFKAALDRLIPKVQAAFDAARVAHDFDLAEEIEAVLSRLYFWRIYARDQLIAALDEASADAMTALRSATATLQNTAADFDQGDHDTDTALTSLDDLAEAVGLKS